MPIRLAFAGFRHGHILELYNLARQRDDVIVVAAVEEHAETRDALRSAGKVEFTHDSYDELFGAVGFDALAVGDYYGRRGQVLIRALESGKHVIADKPICTRLEELERIRSLAKAKNLAVGCQLTLRDSANFLTLREVIRTGQIGQVQTISFSGQHPLLRSTRPGWYFEEGKHGGTLNDIAIHGIDAIGWLTGRRITHVVAARVWNGGLTEPAWFQVGAQLMLRLDNGGGVLGDVSYLAPTGFGYKINSYWRFTVHGSDGQAETSSSADGVLLCANADKQPRQIPPVAAQHGAHFASFLAEIAGRRGGLTLTTDEVLESARITLLAQQAAEQGLRDLPV